MTEERFLANFSDLFAADKYLEHRYAVPERVDFPLPDEDFTSAWIAWLEGRGGFPDEIGVLLEEEGVKVWLEATPAGRIPAVCTDSRRTFETLTELMSAENEEGAFPAGVNAFTVSCKHPAFRGHRVIFLHRAGYSALSGESVGMSEEEWIEKSAAIRVRHECCHYFTLRVLGGMKNHALDEVTADCAGQLAVFGRYSASLQRKFFGLGEENIASGGRLWFYVRELPEGAIAPVCRKINESLDGLERYLAKNAEMAGTNRETDLIVKLAALGLPGIAKLGR
jgi:hypothetical protein